MLRNFGIILRTCELRFSTNAHKIQDVVPNEDVVTKLLKVAVIGVPNVGKSTFINNLMDRKAVFTEGDSQIVFLDTPGLVSLKEFKKFNLEKSFLKDSKCSLSEADLIGVIHDASNVYTCSKLDIKVIRLLEDNKDKPSFLVFNKVDVIKSKRKLLDLTRLVTENCINGEQIPGTKPMKNPEHKGWPHFQDIFMISALTGDGLSQVKNYLIQNAKPGHWMFPPETWTSDTAEQIIVKSVYAKLLDFLPQEIPYTLKPQMELFEVNEQGIIKTVVLVRCPSERIAKLVAGESDGKLRQITASLQHDLQATFQNFVRIKIVLQNPK